MNLLKPFARFQHEEYCSIFSLLFQPTNLFLVLAKISYYLPNWRKTYQNIVQLITLKIKKSYMFRTKTTQHFYSFQITILMKIFRLLRGSIRHIFHRIASLSKFAKGWVGLTPCWKDNLAPRSATHLPSQQFNRKFVSIIHRLDHIFTPSLNYFSFSWSWMTVFSPLTSAAHSWSRFPIPGCGQHGRCNRSHQHLLLELIARFRIELGKLKDPFLGSSPPTTHRPPHNNPNPPPNNILPCLVPGSNVFPKILPFCCKSVGGGNLFMGGKLK